MEHRNYKSDLSAIVYLIPAVGSAAELGWPQMPWQITMWTCTRRNAYVASYDGTTATNCYNDNGKIHVLLDNHGLGPGVLHVEFTAYEPNPAFADGSRKSVVTCRPQVELTACSDDSSLPVNLFIQLPIGFPGTTLPGGGCSDNCSCDEVASVDEVLQVIDGLFDPDKE